MRSAHGAAGVAPAGAGTSRGAAGPGWSVGSVLTTATRARMDCMCMRHRKIIIGYVNAKAKTIARRAASAEGLRGGAGCG